MVFLQKRFVVEFLRIGLANMRDQNIAILKITREPIEIASGGMTVRRTRLTLDPMGRKTGELVEQTNINGLDPAGTPGSTTFGRNVGYRYQATGWTQSKYDLSAAAPAPAVSYLHNLDGTVASATDTTSPATRFWIAARISAIGSTPG